MCKMKNVITMRKTLTQHDDNQRNICTKGDFCNILVLDSQGNEYVGLLA
jgi:hypothetical protein